jgi:hypothetical protein
LPRQAFRQARGEDRFGYLISCHAVQLRGPVLLRNYEFGAAAPSTPPAGNEKPVLTEIVVETQRPRAITENGDHPTAAHFTAELGRNRVAR